MYKLLTSKGQLFAIILGILSVVIAMAGLAGLGSKFEADADLVDVLRKGAAPDAEAGAVALRESLLGMFTMSVYVPIVLIIVALVLAVLFGIKGIADNPKGSMKMLMGVGLVVGIFFLFSVMSGAETSGPLVALAEKFNISDTVSSYISGGIKTALLASAVAFFGAVIMEILNIFK